MTQPAKIVIVGGGYSAAAFAVQLVRNTRIPLDIAIVEPRAQLGRGVAYSTTDPDHRLNAPMDTHAVDPARAEELREWVLDKQLPATDPECVAPGGQFFLRRGDFGAHVDELLARHATDARSGSRIRHVRDLAVSAARVPPRAYTVVTSSGTVVPADMLIVATGNPPPGLPRPFESAHANDPRIVVNPFDASALDRIPGAARVLVVGTGLTALDVLSTLVRRGHQGEILAVSRRGMRPRRHSADILSPAADGQPRQVVRPNLEAPVPPWIAAVPASVRRWLRALRREVAREAGQGKSWHAPFDALRNAVWQIWPALPLAEKQRFMRRLRLQYDVHRFRMPPMNERLVAEAEAQGRVRFAAARIERVDAGNLRHAESAGDAGDVRQGESASEAGDVRRSKGVRDAGDVRHRTGSRDRGQRIVVEMAPAPRSKPVHEAFDYIVNCTGLDHAAATRSNPFLASLLLQGLLRQHGTGMGFDVGPHCEAIAGDGHLQNTLRVIGPPTVGAFGDPLGAIFIAAQVRRILPDVMETLEAVTSLATQERGRQ